MGSLFPSPRLRGEGGTKGRISGLLRNIYNILPLVPSLRSALLLAWQKKGSPEDPVDPVAKLAQPCSLSLTDARNPTKGTVTFDLRSFAGIRARLPKPAIARGF